jgi:hypothetical protein
MRDAFTEAFGKRRRRLRHDRGGLGLLDRRIAFRESSRRARKWCPSNWWKTLSVLREAGMMARGRTVVGFALEALPEAEALAAAREKAGRQECGAMIVLKGNRFPGCGTRCGGSRW